MSLASSEFGSLREYQAAHPFDPDTDKRKWDWQLRTKREFDALQEAQKQAEQDRWSAFVPDVEISLSPLNEYGRLVDVACDSITFEDVFEACQAAGIISHTEKPVRQWTGDSNKFSCPNPQHTDERSSAWGSRDKARTNNHGRPVVGVYHCGVCEGGGDKYTLAGYLYYGRPAERDEFHEMCKRLAADFRGVVEPSPVPVVAVPDPVPSNEDDAQDQAQDDKVDPIEDESTYATFDYAEVLPGTDTFLDLFCAEALKADVPREFPLWTALATLSVAVGRRVALKHIEFPTYANLAICLTSSSASGKGRAMRPATARLREVLPYDPDPLLSGMKPTGVQIIPLPGSGEALLEELNIVQYGSPPTKGAPPPIVKQYSVPALVEFEEMQMLVGKAAGPSSYKTYVIQFADCLNEIGRHSMKYGKGLVRGGFVTFLTATQPRHLRDQFTRRDMSSGLLNRFIFPFGKSVARRAWGAPEQDWDPTNKALKGVAEWAEGLAPNNPAKTEYWITQAEWADDARALWVEFFTTTIDPDMRSERSDLLGRMDLNMLRLILLFAINEKVTQISVRHVRAAFALYDYIKTCALSLAREVTNSEMSDKMKLVLESVRYLEQKLKKPPTKRELEKKYGSGKINAEEFVAVTQKLMNARMLFHVLTKSRTGRGRTGNGYTTDMGLWDATSSVEVKAAPQ